MTYTSLILKAGALLLGAGLLAGCDQNGSSNSGNNNGNGNGNDLPTINASLRSQLVGGSASICSSVVQSACTDWDAYWAANGDAEANVAVTLSEPVELTEQKITALVNDPSWDTDPDFKTGVELILNYLRDQILDDGVAEYEDWLDFRSAFINVANEDVAGLPAGIDGDVIWFDSSSAQYGTFESLKKADERLNYTVTSAKAAAISAFIGGLAADTLDDDQLVIVDVIDDMISIDTLSQDALLAAMANVALEGEVLADGDDLYSADLSYLVDDFNDGDFFRLVDTMSDNGFILEQPVIDEIESQSDWDNTEHQAQVILILQFLLDTSGQTSVNYENTTGERRDRDIFGDAFKAVLLKDGFENGLQVWNSLPSLVRYKLLELLIDELFDYDRPIEYVAVSDTSNANSVAVYQAFVDQARDAAGGETPTILVMTSSSADSYAAADYYVGIFDELGANTQWLPVDRAYRTARDAGQCDWLAAYHANFASTAHLDVLYPDYFTAHHQACQTGVTDLIAEAHGVFINGGDQVRTFESLVTFDGELRVDSPELIQIQARQQDGDLVVGGTSAGAAVQSGGLAANGKTNPMITAGSSHGILVNGFTASNHEPTGGLATFPWGVTDTHFSERAREGRLIRLVEQVDVRFGFGVDETTALNLAHLSAEGEADRVVMQVNGENGVYIVDLGASLTLNAQPFEVQNVVSHYLNSGDRFIWYPATETYEIEFAEGSTEIELSTSPSAEVTDDDILFQDNYRAMAKALFDAGAVEATGTSKESNPRYTVTLSVNAQTRASSHNGKVSYRNLSVELTQDGNH